jgi:TatA/E family protein of Tat protein translocase
MQLSAVIHSIPLAPLGGSFGVGEILLIFVVVLLLFGSKNLPSIARSLGKTLEESRRAARDVSNEIIHAG